MSNTVASHTSEPQMIMMTGFRKSPISLVQGVPLEHAVIYRVRQDARIWHLQSETTMTAQMLVKDCQLVKRLQSTRTGHGWVFKIVQKPRVGPKPLTGFPGRGPGPGSALIADEGWSMGKHCGTSRQ